MFGTPILGDPLTAGKPAHLMLDIYDHYATGQLRPFTPRSPINEHLNEDLGWQEYIERITDEAEGVDLENRWWEYRGKSVRDDVPAPLLLMFHAAASTSWQYIADREGLILLNFEDHRNQGTPGGFLGALGFGPTMEEIKSYHILKERILRKYNIDRSRIYICGQSYGDFSSLIYTSYYGDELAALVSLNGPTSPYNVRRYGITDRLRPLPVLQIRSDGDFTCDGYTAGRSFPREGTDEWIRNIRSRSVVTNRNLWLRANGASPRRPSIRTEGSRALIRYKGDGPEVIYCEFNHKSHQTPLDNAEFEWQNLFSRYRRTADGFVELRPLNPPDRVSLGLVAGSDRCYNAGEVVSLGAPCLVIDPLEPMPERAYTYCREECSYPALYAPVEFLKAGFGADYTYAKAERTHSCVFYGTPCDAVTVEDGAIDFCYGGRNYRLLTNTSMAFEDGFVRDGERPALILNGHLMIPVAQVAKLIGLHADMRNDAVYITDHEFSLGYTLTRFLREEILPDEVYVPRYGVHCLPAEHGSYSVSAEVLDEGETLVVRPQPDAGYQVARVRVAINGVENMTYRIRDDEYWMCNVFGEVDVAVEFSKAE